MKAAFITLGITIIIFSAGFLFVYREYLNPEQKARELLDRGKLYLAEGNVDSARIAVDHLTNLISRFPKTEAGKEAIFRLGEAYEALNLKELAMSKYESLHDQVLSSKLKERISFKIAKLKILKSYREEGLGRFAELLTRTQDRILRSEVYTEMGNYYRDNGKLKDSQRNYEIALREDPENKQARLKLASLLNQQGETINSLNTYENYEKFQKKIEHEEETKSLEYLQKTLQNAKSAHKSGNFQLASRYYSLVYDKFPASQEADEALFQQGRIAMKQKKHLEALKLFNQAISNAPRNRDEISFIKKGEAYFYLGRYKRAAKIFVTSQQIYPRGKYKSVAKNWEKESIKAIQMKNQKAQENDGLLTK